MAKKFSFPKYRDEMQKNLRTASKGSGWKQSKGIVFRQSDDWFVAGHWRNVSSRLADGLKVEILAKPMAIDPMLWETMGLESNNSKPLSFRYWGAFTCGTPVILSETITETDPEIAPQAIIARLNEMLPKLFVILATKKFSEIAKNPAGIHDNWKMNETITQSLRLEQRPDLAIKFAKSAKSGMSVSKLVKDKARVGKSHNEILIDQLTTEPNQKGFLEKVLGKFIRTK